MDSDVLTAPEPGAPDSRVPDPRAPELGAPDSRAPELGAPDSRAPEAGASENPASVLPSRWPARPAPVDRPRPPATGITAALLVNGIRVHVSLAGYHRAEPPPPAALPVVLGEEEDGRPFRLDLGRCPDVLTVAGGPRAVEWYVLGLIRQLLTDEHAVTVLGDDLLTGPLPPGCRRAPAFPDPLRPGSPGIVVCGRLGGVELARARVSRARGGPVPVMLGDLPRSRWSIRIDAG